MATEEYELKNSQSTTNEQIPNSRCITIAYPYCNAGSIALTSKYYIAARSCQGQIEVKTPADFYNTSPMICGSAGTLISEQSFESKLADAEKINGWSVFLLHGLDGDWGYSQLNSLTIDSTLTILRTNQEKYWVATFVNVVCYIKERNCISVKETSVLGSSIKLQVTNTLSDSLYNYSVTIRRPLPTGWSTASVQQNGNFLTSSTKKRHIVPFFCPTDSG